MASVWFMVAGALAVLSAPYRLDTATLIRTLPPQERAELIETYAYSKVRKFSRPPALYLSCPDQGCDPTLARYLVDLRAEAPNSLGREAADRQLAQIEIYVAPRPDAFEARKDEMDKRSSLDSSQTARRVRALEEEDMPCWTASYHDKSGAIEKSLVYIDSDWSPRMQYLCMAHETVRALGINVEFAVIYRKWEKSRYDPFRRLALNAYLHGLTVIKPGLSPEQALSALANLYEPSAQSSSFGRSPQQ